MDHEISAQEKAGMQEEEQNMLKEVALELEAFEKTRGNLIPILQMIQEKYSYVAPESIRIAAEYLEMAACEVYGV
ncbi:MAG: NAD(P)H-dependent oxidoreductase subunit E, partial [Deltaproteobacteria bacterium]|nr:NAD(P)H-dependent oxidoreductase subunit E [Deltaproteobacteria bacterium]